MSGHSGHNEPLDKSWPSHHFKATKNSLGSKWRPSAADGTTDNQEAERGADSDRTWALLATEEDTNNVWNRRLSSFWDKDLCLIGEDRTDSTEGRTWMLKRLIA